MATDRIAEKTAATRRKNWIVLGGVIAMMGFFYWLTIHRISESIDEGQQLRNAAEQQAPEVEVEAEAETAAPDNPTSEPEVQPEAAE
ncbi:MAG: hypothetical protein Alpg2KO_23850 [Alphaproteobacteria bacterium]